MFFSRLTNLFKGKFTRWLKRRESRDPEAVYEAAIADRVKRYQQLKTAAAGVIYMRTKLERELKEKSRELTEVEEQAGQAADLNEDQCALILIRRKHELEDEVARLKEELSQLTRGGRWGQAKPDGASRAKSTSSRPRRLRCWRGCATRRRGYGFSAPLEELPYEDDLRALAEVRESIQRTLAEAGMNREIHESEVDQKLEEIRRRNAETKAQVELAELKRRRRPPLAPLDIFANVQTNGIPAGVAGAG